MTELTFAFAFFLVVVLWCAVVRIFGGARIRDFDEYEEHDTWD